MLTPLSLTLVAKVAVVAPGAVVVHVAHRASRQGPDSLRGMTVGLAAIAAGSTLGGGIDRLVGVRLEVALLVGSLLTLAGFVVLVRSLYADRPVRTTHIQP